MTEDRAINTSPRSTGHVLRGILTTAVLVVLAARAWAITPGTTDTSDFADPLSDWYGLTAAWDSVQTTSLGSAVALGKWHLVTAKHYYFGAGRQFIVNGDTFEVASVTVPPPDAGQTSSPDMEVITVRNLTNPGTPLGAYVSAYTGSFTSGDEMAMIGTGYSGQDLQSGQTHYFTQDNGSGRVKRWGTTAYNYATRTYFENWSTQTLVTNFYSPQTDYESGVAEGDSGAGAFINDGGEWKLAGLVLYRYNPYFTGYRQVRLGSVPEYADWLSQWVSDPDGGDANLDGQIDVSDLGILSSNWGVTGGLGWVDGDFSGDGAVDISDLGILSGAWGGAKASVAMAGLEGADGLADPSAVPEPTLTVSLILAGGLILRRRR